ncbi:MAG: UDP-glucose 4-epimerase GalE [Candidatus Faecousia sp.]|nr:UDP-glucose 4-epimerase GalE [Clostridiales bacterium]MDD7258807.1 UDP-glucose 4-epimerase GalE [Eubacteriales bacterium]MDD7652486.1 UDP-glucose 4-epimerase GalE [Bacillota bacterium]MDY4219937.1 UDP-glucose 4-epimerase GalE [Candidatus Faecousia sp.]
MTVLVTGGMGYIGSHTCLELLNSGYDVVSVDNLCNSSPVSLERVQALTGKKLRSYIGDVRDEALLRRIFSENDIGCVIHFAGLKAVGESVRKPWEYYDNNLNSTLVLTKVMREVGVKRIIFSSSATVYTSDNEMPLKETSRTGGCTNPYGWTKYMTEQILSGISHADGDWSVTLLRYFNPIGAHESGQIGEDPRGIPNNLMPYITQVAVGRRDHLSVFGDDYPTPDGTCIRDYIHVVDLAKGHVAAVEYTVGHKGTEVFNLGTGKGSSVLEMVNTFMEATGVNIPYEITGRRAGDLPECYADPAKSLEILGWRAEKTLADMCRDSWNWQSKNPMGYNG